MLILRGFLIFLWLTLSIYTAFVALNYGMGLLPIFFGDILAMTWSGQFNLDFLFMLSLSALWVVWRHQFSVGGFALGFLAFIGGASFLTVYLLVLSIQTKGEMKEVLLGSRA